MNREFTAPGPGTWVLDTTHNAAAMTLYTSECFVGKPGGSLPPKFLMQLMFYVHPTLRKRVKAAHESFKSRLWLQDLKSWDMLKQDSISRNTALQSIDLSALSDEQLIAHLQECHTNAEEMVFRHHKFSVGSIMPIGVFLDIASRATGLPPTKLAPLLKGSTAVSTGIAGKELVALAAAIRQAGISREQLDLETPANALTLLRGNPAVNAALDAYLAVTGHMLIGGYCISEKTLLESPNIILARINDALAPRAESRRDAELENQIRDKVPEADRAGFDLSLADAREANRMRDERGIYNDIWGSGIARIAILEAGRRLKDRAVLSMAELLLDASHAEILGLLRGETPVTENELQGRRNWRFNKSIDEVPEWVGVAPSEPPPLDWLPEKIRPTMRAFGMVMGNVFDSPEPANIEKIIGLSVSPGIYEGTARVIISTRDFDRLQKGDVLVTKNTSAGFNVVLPIIGALVTDRGGILSHAAIVSREYGIPGVVGTKTATQRIKDGARVRVNGDTGEVTLLP